MSFTRRFPLVGGGHLRRFAVWVAASVLVGLSACTETASGPRYLPLLLVSLGASTVAALTLATLRVSTPEAKGVVSARVGQGVRLGMWIILALVWLDLAVRLPWVIRRETRPDFVVHDVSHGW